VEDILAMAKVKPVCNQVEAHPFLPQDKLKAFLDQKGMALVAYSPLGNLDPNDPTKPSPLRDEAVLGVAKKHGKTPAQVVLRWHVQKGHVVIPKTVTLSRCVGSSSSGIVSGWLMSGCAMIENCTIVQCLTQHPNQPHTRPTRPHARRLAENADVFNWALDAEDMEAIAEAGKKHKTRMVNPGFRPGGQQVFNDEE
jgi:diketogulonate reductase-like aldo/keto reductase